MKRIWSIPVLPSSRPERHWLDYVDTYSIDGPLKEWPATDYRNWYLGDWPASKGTVDVTETESWENPRSTMHNCYNGIESWVFQALGGIIPDRPGYRHVIINPQMPEGLEWVRGSKETPYGTILVFRKKENGETFI